MCLDEAIPDNQQEGFWGTLPSVGTLAFFCWLKRCASFDTHEQSAIQFDETGMGSSRAQLLGKRRCGRVLERRAATFSLTLMSDSDHFSCKSCRVGVLFLMWQVLTTIPVAGALLLYLGLRFGYGSKDRV